VGWAAAADRWAAAADRAAVGWAAAADRWVAAADRRAAAADRAAVGLQVAGLSTPTVCLPARPLNLIFSEIIHSLLWIIKVIVVILKRFFPSEQKDIYRYRYIFMDIYL